MVGVLIVKRRLKSQWGGHAWLPWAVLPAAPAAAPWTRIAAGQNDEVFYAGAFELVLHRSAAAHYRDNLGSAQPSLWVALRPVEGDEVELATVTADPYEGEALAESIGAIVEAVPMPAEIQERVVDYFAAFHVERPFHKRSRERGNPEALARGAPLTRERGEKP
jgi:hypothetical protein